MSKRKSPFEEKARASKRIKTEATACVKEENKQSKNSKTATPHAKVNSIPRKIKTNDEDGETSQSPQNTEKYKIPSTKAQKQDEKTEKKQIKKKSTTKATKTTKTTKATKTKDAKKGKKRKAFARKPINKSLIVKNPKIRVIKLYSRFDSVAKAKGVLKYPVSTAAEPFENFGVCSGNPMKELSPMLLGPVMVDGKIFAQNIEDGWQGSKVWSAHMTNGRFDPKSPGFWATGQRKLDVNGVEWLPEWEKWSKYIRMSGLGKRRHFKTDPNADNPNIPLFSYFKGKRLSYVASRKVMYIPWYDELVRHTEAFKYLKSRFDAGISLNLLEFDGMPRHSADDLPAPVTEASLRRFVNDPKVIFGHGMVLAASLMGCKPWIDNDKVSNGDGNDDGDGNGDGNGDGDGDVDGNDDDVDVDEKSVEHEEVEEENILSPKEEGESDSSGDFQIDDD